MNNSMNEFSKSPDVVFPLVWYDEEFPEVSIVVLNYNKAELTSACIEYIWAHTTGRRYEIIVVDNGSSNENGKLFRVSCNVRLLRLTINRFFGEGNNIGVEAARGNYVVFLNNDAFVTEGWLDPLVRRMEEEPLLGGVGPQFLYPDGRLQEAGSFVAADGGVVQIGKLHGYSASDVEEDHIVDYISAACFLMRRELFLTVGGFEYAYEPAYYEDVDLCLKIKKSGYFVSYCSESRVVHIENATTSENREKLGLETIIDINRSRFLRFWGDYLSKRDEKILINSPAIQRPSKRPRAVFYTPYDITPGGGERYLLTAASALLQEFDVYVATEETYSRTRLHAIGRDLSLDIQRLDLIERRNLGEIGPIDISILMCNEALPPFSGFALRNLVICQFPFPQHWSEDLRRYGNLDTFDGTIVYSEFVREQLKTKRDLLGVGGHPVDIITPPVPIAPAGTQLAPLKPPFRIVVVGRFFTGGHNKRHDIAIEVVRRLVAAGIPVQLDLIGSLLSHPTHRNHYQNLLSLAKGLPIIFHPNASLQEFSSILAQGHLYIHAAGYGVDTDLKPHECEHFGISVLEAMSYGLVPFVVANGGPAGFIRNGESGYIYSTVDELVHKIQAALEKPDELLSLRIAALTLSKNYSEVAFVEAWRSRATALLS